MRARAAGFVLAIAGTACAPAPAAPPTERLVVADVLGGSETTGFARATAPRPFSFPEDHGPHPEFAAEWWYFTGNLTGAAGDSFGYQLTFFRTSLTPQRHGRSESAWATDQVWMAHFAVTDVDGERFFAFDRFQRGALGLAGASADPWRVWVDGWSLQQQGDEPFPLRLQARAGTDDYGDGGLSVAVDLSVRPIKELVLQGDRGLSQKGSAVGNASYYYSFTRLETIGSVTLGDRTVAVKGESWLDREYSTGALEPGQVGWDWFALQLDDGSELMYYQLRDDAGSASPQSAGVLVDRNGRVTRLAREDVLLTVENSWASPRDGTLYPAGWHLSVAEHDVELRIAPRLPDQELDLAFRYWEGAVSVVGLGADGRPVRGRGYVELTGYAGGGPHP